MFLKDLYLRYVTFSSCYYIHSAQGRSVPSLLVEEWTKQFTDRLSFNFSEKESYFILHLHITLGISSKLSVELEVGEVCGTGKFVRCSWLEFWSFNPRHMRMISGCPKACKRFGPLWRPLIPARCLAAVYDKSYLQYYNFPAKYRTLNGVRATIPCT